MSGDFPTALIDGPGDAGQVTRRHRAGAWRDGEEPNQWFNSRWYAMRNNDWTHFESPFDHFLRRGLAEDRAPSPMIDMTRFRETDRDRTPRQRYEQLVRDGGQPGDGTYGSFDDLRAAQRALLDTIEPAVLRCEPRPRRHLVIAQFGSRRADAWLSANEDRSYDVLLNHYDGRTEPIGFGEIEVTQIGTKFSANHKLVDVLLEEVCAYDYVWLLDDDVEIDTGSIEASLDWCERIDAPLAQPALSATSSSSWPELLVSHEPAGPEPTPINAAEIMMPIMRIDFWLRAVRYFPWSISGYGLDLLWAEMLADEDSSAWRLPTVASHERPVDSEHGSYYRFLRSHDINPETEWWQLVETFGLGNQIGRDPR